MKNKLRSGFIGFSLVYLILALSGHEDIAWFFKPLLLPFLIMIVSGGAIFESKKWLLGALLFSWIGDIILMFADRGELYFIVGLVSFLISHIFYIILFTKQHNEIKGHKNPIFWLGCLLVLFYLQSMLALLFPTLGTLKIPVTVYAATISLMLIIAWKGYFSWTKTGKFYVLAGAICFVISDSLLAIDKFHEALPYATFSIMLTYLLAQYLIVNGILKLHSKNQ